VQQSIGQLTARADQVLAIVQHQQQLSLRHKRGERLDQCLARPLAYAENGGDCARNERRIR
jgi:hypothetical protein